MDQAEHELGDVRAQARELARDLLRPAAVRLDRMRPEEVIAAGSPLWEVVRSWHALGNHAASFPESLGGGGLDARTQAAISEELGWGAVDLAITVGVSAFAFGLAHRLAELTGNQRVVEAFVAPFVADREGRYVGCWAITEPGHGSDTLGVGLDSFGESRSAGACRARRSGRDWVISGQKSAWVSNGTIATHALLFCTLDTSRGMAGGGVALVPLDLPGVSKGPPLDKLGQRGLNQGEIFFDDVVLPGFCMLVEPDLYPAVLEATLASANTGMGVLFAGLARAAFDEALAYAKSRTQGGKPICSHQLVAGKLFEMYARVQAAHALAQGVASANANDTPSLADAIASKVSSTRLAFEVASDAIQVFGGTGLVKGQLVEKLFRDARAALIEDGVNEFLALVGASKLVAGAASETAPAPQPRDQGRVA